MHGNMSEEYWGRFPDTYDKRMEYVVGRELIEEIIQELNRLSELGELVEFGYGTGIYTEVIVSKEKSMIATDLSDSLLAVARTCIGDHPEVTIQKENCMATSFSSEALDSVFMANLIHVIESLSRLLEECYRILRKSGILVIVTFTDKEMIRWEKIKMGLRFVKSWGKPPAHAHSFSPDNLGSMIAEAGFIIETSKVLGNKTKAVYIIGRKAQPNNQQSFA